MARAPTIFEVFPLSTMHAPTAIYRIPPTRLMMYSSVAGIDPRRYVSKIAGIIMANPTNVPIPRYLKSASPPQFTGIWYRPSCIPSLAIISIVNAKANSTILNIPGIVFKNPVFKVIAISKFFAFRYFQSRLFSRNCESLSLQ